MTNFDQGELVWFAYLGHECTGYLVTYADAYPDRPALAIVELNTVSGQDVWDTNKWPNHVVVEETCLHSAAWHTLSGQYIKENED